MRSNRPAPRPRVKGLLRSNRPAQVSGDDADLVATLKRAGGPGGPLDGRLSCARLTGSTAACSLSTAIAGPTIETSSNVTRPRRCCLVRPSDNLKALFRLSQGSGEKQGPPVLAPPTKKQTNKPALPTEFSQISRLLRAASSARLADDGPAAQALVARPAEFTRHGMAPNSITILYILGQGSRPSGQPLGRPHIYIYIWPERAPEPTGSSSQERGR